MSAKIITRREFLKTVSLSPFYSHLYASLMEDPIKNTIFFPSKYYIIPIV